MLLMTYVKGHKPVATAGRPKGSLNKATADVKTLASQFAPDAFKVLNKIMLKGKTEIGRVAAAKELLDRAYGKSTQHNITDLTIIDDADALVRGRDRLSVIHLLAQERLGQMKPTLTIDGSKLLSATTNRETVHDDTNNG